MQPLKAAVRNGKLVLDETPTKLPEGTEAELVLVEPSIDDTRKSRPTPRKARRSPPARRTSTASSRQGDR